MLDASTTKDNALRASGHNESDNTVKIQGVVTVHSRRTTMESTAGRLLTQASLDLYRLELIKRFESARYN